MSELRELVAVVLVLAGLIVLAAAAGLLAVRDPASAGVGAGGGALVLAAGLLQAARPRRPRR